MLLPPGIDPTIFSTFVTATAGVVVAVVAGVVSFAVGRGNRKAAIEQARATIVAAALGQGVGDLAHLNTLASLTADRPSLSGSIPLSPPNPPCPPTALH